MLRFINKLHLSIMKNVVVMGPATCGRNPPFDQLDKTIIISTAQELCENSWQSVAQWLESRREDMGSSPIRLTKTVCSSADRAIGHRCR